MRFRARLTAPLLLLLWLALCPQTASATHSAEVRGAWLGGSIPGTRLPHAAQPGCIAFQWVERSLTLNQLPGEPAQFRGILTEHTQNIWTSADSQQCRWAHEPAVLPFYDALTDVRLSGHLDAATGVLTVTAHRLSCHGAACAELSRSPETDDASREYTLTFHLAGEDLLEDMPSGDPLVFERAGRYAAGIQSAQELTERVHREFDDGLADPTTLLQLSLLFVDGLAPPAQALAVARRALTSRIEERDLQAAFVAHGQRIGVGPRSSVRTAMMLTHSVCADGRAVGELLVLQQEASGWRIAWLQFL